MAEIIFQSKSDADRFYHHLLNCLHFQADSQKILLIEEQNIVRILEENSPEVLMERVKEAFFEFIVKLKRDDWFRSILENKFYFADQVEQQQIIEIIASALEGQREDLAVLLKETCEEPAVKEAIDEILLENIAFSFDSFLKFRLRSYMQMLERYVEISIDEYKMEQEYQVFVQMLREFLKGREPKVDILHLLFDDEITFYNKDFEEIKRGDLIKMIDRKLLVNHPVYVDSASIAPLLSLAPTGIFLYTRTPDAPLVRTIKNIFEERVNIKSYDAFLAN